MAALRKSGRGGKLSAQSIVLAYRVLRAALQEAVKLELLARNVCDPVSPRKREGSEVEILDADQIATVLAAIKSDRLYPIAALAIATGMRRGELLALQWRDVDLERGILSVERSLEQTGEGLRFKGPKSRHGKREISLPPSAVERLRLHRRQQLELRLQLGMGKPADDALVFSDHEGRPISPNSLSTWWRRAIAKLPNIPHVRFHALRHSHASALISAGIDVVKVSRRLGHGSATITLNVYAHLFNKADDDATKAVEAVLGGSL